MRRIFTAPISLVTVPARFVWRLLWRRVFLANLTAGLGVWIPIALTVVLGTWAAGHLVAFVGPGTPVGDFLRGLGLRFVDDAMVATVIGWVAVGLVVWITGLLALLTARSKAKNMVDGALDRIPAFGTVHKSLRQVTGLMLGDGAADLKKMSVVMCRFGEGAGVLALLTSRRVYAFGGRRYHLVFMSSSPMPMTGGLIFVEVGAVEEVDMQVDDLAKLYMTLGLMAPQVMPLDNIEGGPADLPDGEEKQA